jgi:hypothetical protein
METVLVFAGIPIGVAVVVAGFVYTGSARRGRRYRPGRPFDFRPVWFLSAPESSAETGAQPHALTGQPSRPALAAGGANEWPPTDPAQQVATGGASDRW